MRQFGNCRVYPGMNGLVYTELLKWMLSPALPTLNDDSSQKLRTEQLMPRMRLLVREQFKIINFEEAMTLTGMKETAK